jgi:hypothetical protein
MPIDLGNPEWIVLVADSDTPAELQQYQGRLVGIPAGIALPDDGHVDSITVSGLTVWGYLRWSPGGFHEWVMSAPLNPNVVAINAIPVRGQWTNLDARNVYYGIGQVLLGLGVPGGDLRAGLKQLYDAANADAAAAIQGGFIPPVEPNSP